MTDDLERELRAQLSARTIGPDDARAEAMAAVATAVPLLPSVRHRIAPVAAAAAVVAVGAGGGYLATHGSNGSGQVASSPSLTRSTTPSAIAPTSRSATVDVLTLTCRDGKPSAVPDLGDIKTLPSTGGQRPRVVALCGHGVANATCLVTVRSSTTSHTISCSSDKPGKLCVTSDLPAGPNVSFRILRCPTTYTPPVARSSTGAR